MTHIAIQEKLDGKPLTGWSTSTTSSTRVGASNRSESCTEQFSTVRETCGLKIVPRRHRRTDRRDHPTVGDLHLRI